MSKGRHIIASAIEHPSVTETLDQLTELFGFEVTYLPADQNGFVSLKDVKSAIRPDTIIVSVMHVNNEVGSIQPVKEIGGFLKQHRNILFHVDHVQGIHKVPLSIEEAGIDLCTVSGHKFHGLKGPERLSSKRNAAHSAYNGRLAAKRRPRRNGTHGRRRFPCESDQSFCA